MQNLKLLSGNANRPLALKIASNMGIHLANCDINRFPDGETAVQIQDNIRGCDVFIVQPTSPPVNENLMELLIMVDAAKRASAKRITAVIPYYGYARQDRKDRPRVPITAKLVANLLVSAGVNRVITLDLHSDQIQGFFDIPSDHLEAKPLIAEWLKFKDIPDLCIVASDAGGAKTADAYAGHLGCGLAVVNKRRVSATDVKAKSLIGEVAGKNCVIIDDMTSTAGTLVEASKLLTEHGAKSVTAIITHSLINNKGLFALQQSPIDTLVRTDSIAQTILDGGDKNTLKIETLSIAPLLGQAIVRTHTNSSVTNLFAIF